MSIKQAEIDFKSLVEKNNGGLTIEFSSKLIDELRKNFNDEDQQWFIANFYVYLHYHPTKEFPINLENIYKMIGFATKANAKRTLKNNFIEGEDYTISKKDLSPGNTIIRRDDGKFSDEEVLLNVDTFKNLCMITKTEKSKKIRKYYIKLEGLFNELVNQQRKEYEEKINLLEEENIKKEEKIKILEHKPETYGFSCRKSGFVYLIRDRKKPGHYKIGMAVDSNKRIGELNTASSEKSLELVYEIDAYDREFFERTIHSLLQPFNIRGRREWFYFSNDDEVNYAIFVMDSLVNQLQQFNIQSHQDLEQFL